MVLRASWLLAAMLLVTAGCNQSPPQSQPTANAPPVPALPGATTPAPGPTPSTPGQPASPSNPPAVTATPSAVVLQIAHDRTEKATRQLIEAFDSIEDDASVDAAIPTIRTAGNEMAASMEDLKKAVAALSLAGQDDEVDKFYQGLGERLAAKGKSDELNFPNAIERVLNSPQGPRIQGEVNQLLDKLLAASTSGGRRGLERMIEQKKLRR